MASEFGWEYHLVDEGWKKWGKTVPESMDKVAQLVSYAAGKQVGIWVWVRWSDVNNPANDWESMRSFFSSLAKTGIKGIKIDFMDSASRERLAFYDAVAENLAKNKLMVNFHGANTPTGEERSWPHEMSREGIYGGEQNIWAAIGGRHYCALPFTRLVSGHADFTGGYFGHGPSCAALPGPSRWRPISFIRPSPPLGIQPRRHGSRLPERLPGTGSRPEHSLRMG